MIGRLTGLIEERDSDYFLIDVHGVGYIVYASQNTISRLPQPPEIARVFIETIVREDAFLLYGFLTHSERRVFQLLRTVQGVGARAALSILSIAPVDALMGAISAKDQAFFAQASGVGKRLALRIVTELEGKVGDLPADLQSQETVSGSGIGEIRDQAIIALEQLGFKRNESWSIINRILSEDRTIGLEELIQLSLKNMDKT